MDGNIKIPVDNDYTDAPLQGSKWDCIKRAWKKKWGREDDIFEPAALFIRYDQKTN